MEQDSTAGSDRRKRWVVAIGSLGATALFAYVALLLGAWGFDTRRFSQHERRLGNLVRQAPRLDQVEQAFQDEGTVLLSRPGSSAELRQVVAERGGPRAAEILEKAAKWPVVRVFLAGDMVYFAFFDTEGVMHDFLIVSR